MIDIFYYEKSRGKAPVKEWFDSLERGNQDSIKLLRIINHRLELLKAMGMKLGRPHCDCLTSGRNLVYHIFELRMRFNKNTYRIFFGFYNEDIIILLHWVQKKTQKVEKSDIDLSLRRMKEWVIKNG